MSKVDRLIYIAKNQMKSLIPSIMAVFIVRTGDKVKKTVCYQNNGDGYSKEELFECEDEALKSIPESKQLYPVIHFVKASELKNRVLSNSNSEEYQRYLH